VTTAPYAALMEPVRGSFAGGEGGARHLPELRGPPWATVRGGPTGEQNLHLPPPYSHQRFHGFPQQAPQPTLAQLLRRSLQDVSVMSAVVRRRLCVLCSPNHSRSPGYVLTCPR
jgi:hypothetical protein